MADRLDKRQGISRLSPFVRITAVVAILLGATPGWTENAPPGITPQPLRVVLVLDRSGSMNVADRRQRLIDSVAALMVSLPRSSELGVVVFNHLAEQVLPLTRLDESCLDELITTIDGHLAPQGGTDILGGVDKALDMCGPAGGRIVLLSDGYQSGIGTEPAPESMWGEPARALALRARQQQVLLHAVGLGPEVAADPLLRLLAAETGGSFHPVRDTRDLLAEYIGLACRLGRYWRCSQASQFTVARPVEVIQVVPADAPHQLFREAGRQWIPVDPSLSIQRGVMRAERLPLTPGRYAFRPDSEGPSELLRPLDVVPVLGTAVLPAARNTKLGVALEAITPQAEHLPDLSMTVYLRYGKENSFSKLLLPRTQHGWHAAPLKTPAFVGPFTIVVDLQEESWRYRSEPQFGQLSSPDPLDVQVTVDAALPLEIVTREPSLTAALDLSLETEVHGHAVDVTLACADVGIQVSPSRIRLQGGRQQARIQLTRQETDAKKAGGLLRTQLRLDVESDDLVPATVNGQLRTAWDLSWHHRRPKLDLVWPERTEPTATQRGATIQLPVALSGTDLDGQDTGVRLDTSRLPAGFEASWESPQTDERGAVSRLLPNAANPGLRLSVSDRVLPGVHVLDLGACSTDPTVPLNGQLRPLELQLPIRVLPVQVRISLDEAPSKWTVMAPQEAARIPVQVVVASADGGPLPACDLKAVPEPPTAFEVSLLRDERVSGSERRVMYELEIPAQSPPFLGSLGLRAVGADVACEGAARLAVEVPPSVVQVACDPVQLPRYLGIGKQLFDWFHPTEPVAVPIRFDGDRVRELAPAWQVVQQCEDGSEQLLAAEPDGRFLLDADRHHFVVLTSPYEHAEFRHPDLISPNRIRLPIQEVEVPVPMGYLAALIAISGGLMAVVGWHILRPVKVTVGAGAGIVWGWGGRLRLGRVLHRPGLRLNLSRRWLRRHRRDTSNDRVVLDSKLHGRVPLRPGDFLSVFAGDVIELETPEGDLTLIRLLSGVRPPKHRRDSVGLGITEDLGEEAAFDAFIGTSSHDSCGPF